MSPTYKTLTAITAWVCFIMGVVAVLVPLAVGMATGNLSGSITDVEAGKLWFYRHGQSFLISAVFFVVYLYSVKVRKSLD